MIVTITNIRKAERDTKRGKSMSISIQTEQFGNKWIGGWENDTNKDWVVGQRVGIETIQNGDYLNYNLSEEQPPKEEKQIATTEKTRTDNIALMNAKNNATALVCELIKKDSYKKAKEVEGEFFVSLGDIEADISRLTAFLYTLKTAEEGSDLPF